MYENLVVQVSDVALVYSRGGLFYGNENASCQATGKRVSMYIDMTSVSHISEVLEFFEGYQAQCQ